VSEILTKEGFSVMAVLICILGGLPNDGRVASFRFLKSTPQRYRTSKKLCTDGIVRFSRNLGLETGLLESTAQIISLNMIYCLRNCCSVSFDYQLMITTVNLFLN